MKEQTTLFPLYSLPVSGETVRFPCNHGDFYSGTEN